MSTEQWAQCFKLTTFYVRFVIERTHVKRAHPFRRFHFAIHRWRNTVCAWLEKVLMIDRNDWRPRIGPEKNDEDSEKSSLNMVILIETSFLVWNWYIYLMAVRFVTKIVTQRNGNSILTFEFAVCRDPKTNYALWIILSAVLSMSRPLKCAVRKYIARDEIFFSLDFTTTKPDWTHVTFFDIYIFICIVYSYIMYTASQLFLLRRAAVLWRIYTKK